MAERERNADQAEALEAVSPEARELLELIFEHNAKEAEWASKSLEEMAENDRLRAIEQRGADVRLRFNELFFALFRTKLLMNYDEEELSYGTRKVLEIVWLDDQLDDIIYPMGPFAQRD